MAILIYTASYLCHVAQATRTAYSTYHLDYSIRSHVISVGIRRQPTQQKCRRSRASKNLFDKIHPIVGKWNNWDRLNINQSVTVSNLIAIKKEPITSRCFHLAHINARSINNNIYEFQHYVVDNRETFVLSWRAGLKRMLNILQRKSHQMDTKLSLILGLMEAGRRHSSGLQRLLHDETAYTKHH